MSPRAGERARSRIVIGALFGALSACHSGPPPASPFSAAETDRALEPAKHLRERCYDSSALARAGKKIALDFKLEIERSGHVHSFPTYAEPDDPEIIECVRHELDRIEFPARGRDRLDLHFEMGR